MKLALFLAVALISFAYGQVNQASYWQIDSDSNFQADYNHYKSAYPGFDWSTDGCSVPMVIQAVSRMADKYVAKFYWPCVQHDFGYRNAGHVGLKNENARAQVDQHLKDGMMATCSR